ncbi:class I adenylate-forming enzyme family protein [Pikeienuella sp. HZG-20]|uniref:class I adenylate-forming enzyme family protein n=1 Tax=Paludibacillus litoralis TaxID=3133267 RepID=UPI0030EE13A3
MTAAEGAPAMRAEAHFGDRVIRCFVDRPGSVGAMLAAAAAAHGARDALVDGDLRLSHAELERRAAALAGGLHIRGVRAGDRVAILIQNRWEFVLALLGVIRAGAIATPIPVRSSAPEIAYILEDSGAALTISDRAMETLLPEGAPRVVVGDAGPDGFEALLAGPPAPAPVVAEEDAAVILYTSGTTGAPKGAMLTHLNIVHSSLTFVHAFSLGPEDRTVVAVPASHVTGLIAGIFSPLAAGGAVVMLERFEVAAFLTLAAAERMSFTVLVPAMYNLCLLRADLSDYDLSAWRIGSFGGAPMPVATIEKLGAALPGLTLMQAYGATETTSPATIMPLGLQADHPASVGAPVATADILVMNEAGEEVPVGVSGEIWIGGPMIVSGYWNKKEKTAESFHAGFWRSGDIGRFDENGLLYVHDRLKDMINRGGYNIYSVEVENALSFHPAVAEAAVVPRPDPVLGEKTHAFVHLSGAAVDEAALRAFCRERLSDYKAPDSFTFMDEPLPRNANGKVMKHKLREILAAMGVSDPRP